MIVGIGVDLLNINRIEKVYNKFGNKFVERILAMNEIQMFNKTKNKVNFLAKRFCAKEAFSKAIGIGIGRGIDMRDISITNDSLGKPIILLNENCYTFIEQYYQKERNTIQINISITDEIPFVNSFVIISVFDEQNKIETI